MPLLQPDPTAPASRVIAGVPLLTSPTIANDIVWALPKARIILALREGTTVESDRSVFFTSSTDRGAGHGRVSWGFLDPAAITKIATTPMTTRDSESRHGDLHRRGLACVRYGVAGRRCDVHPDHVERFDRLNGGAPPAAPKKRPARKR